MASESEEPSWQSVQMDGERRSANQTKALFLAGASFSLLAAVAVWLMQWSWFAASGSLLAVAGLSFALSRRRPKGDTMRYFLLALAVLAGLVGLISLLLPIEASYRS